MSEVIIYTDGSCSSQDGSGGYGAILISNGRELIVTGHVSNTTNNRMELMAAVAGLAALKRRRRRRWKVKLYSDSAYLVNCFQCGWIPNWRAHEWMTYSGKPVANRELWETLESLVSLFDVEFIHVKGHSGHALNERADQIASEARKEGLTANAALGD